MDWIQNAPKKSKNKTTKITQSDKNIDIYIRGEFRKSLGMNFFSLFNPEREFKVKLYAVEYITTKK